MHRDAGGAELALERRFHRIRYRVRRLDVRRRIDDDVQIDEHQPPGAQGAHRVRGLHSGHIARDVDDVLFVNRRSIDEHGGRIWTENLSPSVDRPAGGGAVFHIDLPVGVPETLGASDASPGIASSAAATGRRVLVVDDEWSIRALLHDILRLDHHEVALASSGIEAADLAERERFDVILTDIKMPGMDGAAFYRHVRERDPEQARRIIFITGDTVSPDTRMFLQSVANPVLSKPFKIGPLRDAIETVLAY